MRLQGRALPEGKRTLGWLTGWAGPGTFSTELGCRENVFARCERHLSDNQHPE